MNIKDLIFPFWEGNIVRDETILPIGASKETACAPLFFKADEILSVKSSDLKTEYEQGKDWIYENGKIKLTPDSRIPYMKQSDLHFKERTEECFEAKDGAYVLHKKGGFFHKMQTAVTYRHSDSIDFGTKKAQGKVLQRTRDALLNKRSLKICFYGDSITVGCDVSSMFGAEPNMPPWFELVKAGLEMKYDVKTEVINNAVSGKSSDWGAEHANERIAAYNPDLAVIGFGMNDGTKKLSPETFFHNIIMIKAAVIYRNPQCEFIFIAPTLANPKSVFDGLQRKYYNELLQCLSERDAVVNMTKIHDILLRRKKFEDMTGNNINHPNDFLARIYAQAVLSLF